MHERDAERTGRSSTFEDVPKLELDQLIDQLVVSAEGVKRAQGRLRVLLRAVDMINADLDLDGVLEHTAEAAAYLTDAQNATIGVLGAGGVLRRSISVDLGAIPRHVGVIPAVDRAVADTLRDGKPVRLPGPDAQAAGIPNVTRETASVLAVPVRVRAEVFAHLFLLESDKHEFTGGDEELITLLAAAAGTAIDNARLYQQSREQQRWLRASADISAQLLAATGEDPLQTVARHVLDVADADAVTVGVITPDGEDVLVEVAVGRDADSMIGSRVPVADSISGDALAAQQPLIVASVDDIAGRSGEGARGLGVGPIMVVPLTGPDVPLGVLTIVRRRGAAPFSEHEVDMAGRFAAQAAVALELTSARADRQRVELLEDRDRIARDLHDHVIQQLFAIGLSLQGLAALGSDQPDLAGPLEERVEDIDRTIRQIRTTIFALRNPSGPASGLRGTLLAIGSELTPALGFSPGFTFAGPVDTMVNDSVADDVRACVRGALSSVAKCASARRAFVDVATDVRSVTVRVTDDGNRGPSPDQHGIKNIATLAERRGGTLEVKSPSTGGTELVWKAPLS